MADAKTYDFNSVGETDTFFKSRNSTQTESFPIGIKTPLEDGIGTDGLFKMHRSVEATVSDNLRNLILTNHGERIFRHDYGANLRELAFELGTEDGDFEAINRIRNAVRKYLPFINMQTFETFQVAATYTSPAKVGVKVTYSVPGLTTKTKILEVIISTVS